jgi:hypothetical protein
VSGPLPYRMSRKLIRGSLFMHDSDHPGALHNRDVAMRCRAHPNEWVDLNTRMTRTQAHVKASAIRRKPPRVFQPIGAFEVESRAREDGWAVRVRFIGWPP